MAMTTPDWPANSTPIPRSDAWEVVRRIANNILPAIGSNPLSIAVKLFADVINFPTLVAAPNEQMAQLPPCVGELVDLGEVLLSGVESDLLPT